MKTLLRFALPAVAAAGVLVLAAARTGGAPAMAGGMTLNIKDVHTGGVPPSNVESFEWNLSATGGSTTSATGAGRGTGRPQYGDLVVTVQLDQAAPAIVAGAASGKMFHEVTLAFGTQGSIKLNEARIMSVKWASGQAGPLMTLSFAYMQIDWEWGGKHAAADLMHGAVH